MINRMGFPNDGLDNISARLRHLYQQRWRPVIGINIGKLRTVALDSAVDDYVTTFSGIQEFADYAAINVSSPNTPELRKLQEKSRLAALFQRLQASNSRKIPLLVKIAPDLSVQEIDDVIACCLENGVNGIIATNTTLSRDGLSSTTSEQGGLSGRPLYEKALHMVSHIYRRTGGTLPIIGVGGVFSAEHAWSLFRAGASLVQIYTGLVYEGPSLVKRLKRELLELMTEHGISNLSELIGCAHRQASG